MLSFQVFLNVPNDPVEIKNQSKMAWRCVQRNGNIQASDEAALLTLRDARLFVIAICRLPRKEQKKVLSKTVSVLNASLIHIRSDEQLLQAFTSNKEASGFVARVITLSSAAVDAVTAGKSHLDLISQEIGETHYHLPSLIDISERNVDFEVNDNDWYKRELCYMGLLSDWESAILPVPRTDDTVRPLSDEDLAKFSSSLEAALEIDFESARLDHCHLTFCA
jgi:hypothetical protein